MTGGTAHPINAINADERDWTLDARCRGTSNPDMWFPTEAEFNHHSGKQNPWNWSLMSARVVCSECPVRLECLRYALAHHEEFGIWGGLTVNQRRKLRRQDTA